METRPRHLLALRAIVVSGRAALLKAPTADERKHIQSRITNLLAQLKATAIRDGADVEVLARVDRASREARE